MGTLHSAASVIQIHFRYMRHLREAGIRPKPSHTMVEHVPIDEKILDDSGFINSEDELAGKNS